jgi:hypothetical protein
MNNRCDLHAWKRIEKLCGTSALTNANAVECPDIGRGVSRFWQSKIHSAVECPDLFLTFDQLQALTYQNGFLESQLLERQRDIEKQDEQLKLLTDSQHNRQGWWTRFCSWFISPSV